MSEVFLCNRYFLVLIPTDNNMTLDRTCMEENEREIQIIKCHRHYLNVFIDR